jgi:hypothetical protein
MLAAAPNSGKIPVDYTFGLVDSIMHDEELHKGYDELGFSFAVVALAVREVRRECKYIPTAQEVLQACQKHCRAFRDLGYDVEMLMRVRKNAELVIVKAAEEDEMCGLNEPIPPRPPGWQPPPHDPEIDGELPF